MELSKKSMVIGIILTLVCVVVGIVCLIINPTAFTIVMFAAIVALALFQSIAFWLLVRKKK